MANIHILANSRKLSGYCVAGKDVATNKWVRLVGDKNGAELDLNGIAFTDFAGIKHKIPYEPFNRIIQINLGSQVPLNYQPENVLINNSPWQEVQVAKSNISCDDPDDLWGTGDRIKASDINECRINIAQSLYLIEVTDLRFYTNDYNANRAYFCYKNNEYNLGVTINPSAFNDIVSEKREHNNILTISLAGPFLNKYSNQLEHYKLVAAVF